MNHDGIADVVRSNWDLPNAEGLRALGKKPMDSSYFDFLWEGKEKKISRKHMSSMDTLQK